MRSSPSTTRYRYRYVRHDRGARLEEILAVSAILVAVLGFGLVLLLSA